MAQAMQSKFKDVNLFDVSKIQTFVGLKREGNIISHTGDSSKLVAIDFNY